MNRETSVVKPTITKVGVTGYSRQYIVRWFVRRENGQDWFEEKTFSSLSDARAFAKTKCRQTTAIAGGL